MAAAQRALWSLQQVLPFESRTQQDPRLLPFPLQGTLGDAAHRGDLGKREAAEELEIHQLRQRRIESRERIDRIAQRAQLVGARTGLRGRMLEARDLEPAAPLDGGTVADQVDDQIA